MREASLYRIDYEIEQNADWQVHLVATDQRDAIDYLKKRTGTSNLNIRQISELGVIHQLTDTVADMIVHNRVGESQSNSQTAQKQSSTKKQ